MNKIKAKRITAFAAATILTLQSAFGILGVISVPISAEAATTFKDASFESFVSLMASEDEIILDSSVTLSETVVLSDGRTHTIDLNGNDIDMISESGSAAGSVFEVSAGTTLIIRDDTGEDAGEIRGGHSAGNGGGICLLDSSKLIMNGGGISGNIAENGSGIYIGEGCSATLDGVSIIGNDDGHEKNVMRSFWLFGRSRSVQNKTRGGGIYVSQTGSCELNGCTIESNNTSEKGAGVYNEGFLEVSDTVIKNNVLKDSGEGAGIYTSGDAIVTGSEITDNKDAKNGGGICNTAKLSIENSAISGNSARANGGGIYQSDSSAESKLTLSGNNQINNNVANSGGGIYLNCNGAKEKHIIKNTSFSGNYSYIYGGALMLGDSGSEVELSDVIMEGNVSEVDGGAIYSESSITVNDSMIKQNIAYSSGGGMYLAYSDGKKRSFSLANSSISENIAKKTGGGIRLYDDRNTEVSLGSGKNIIYMNKEGDESEGDSNLVFEKFTRIGITGKFDKESMIGVTVMEDCDPKDLTADFSDHNNVPAYTYFTYDRNDYKIAEEDKRAEAYLAKRLKPSASGYTITVSVKVTNDADDWDDAHVEIWGRKSNGTGEKYKVYTTPDIKEHFDDEGDTYTLTYDCGKTFPVSVDVYTNFGGGGIYRGWEADTTIMINGVNCKSTHLEKSLWGNTAKKGVANNWIDIESDKFPHIEQKEIDQRKEIDLAKEKTKEVSLTLVDQYGVEIKPDDDKAFKIENISYPNEDTYENKDGHGLKWVFDTTKKDECHNSTYVVSFKSSDKDWTEVPITVRFKPSLTVTIRVGSKASGYEIIEKHEGSAGESISFSKPAAAKGYELKSPTKDNSCVLTEKSEGSYDFTFIAQNVVITFESSPIKYKVYYLPNTSMNDTKKRQTTMKYDNAYFLEKKIFNNKNYNFIGWNTEPDGSGTAYDGGARVINLTDKKDTIVMLYAQWEDPDAENNPTTVTGSAVSGSALSASIFSGGNLALWFGFAMFLIAGTVFACMISIKNRR